MSEYAYLSQGNVKLNTTTNSTGIISDDRPYTPEKKPERFRFFGKTKEEMNDVLFLLYDIQDEIELDAKETELYDIAIRCVFHVMNHVLTDSSIT